jgi:glycerol-3-phosphate O-acyltransferase / dihydroxyacetone phosphate acyltransferase
VDSGSVAATEDFSDCERRGSGWIDQDVNAWTSLGYVAVGLLLVAEVARSRLPRSIIAFAAFVVVEGFGSFVYHADATDLSQGLHDIPLAAMVAFIAGWHVGRLLASPGRYAVSGLAVGVLIGTILMASDIQGVNAVVAVGVAVVIVSELLARGRHLTRVWTPSLLVLTGGALVCWFLGTPTSPVCEADSWAQLHGVWHLLTALLALAWVDRAVAVAQPDHPPLLLRRGTDRAIGLLALVLVHVFHRSVDVRGRERVPSHRPVLIVANHGNGFVDPIVVAAALGTLPRFLAKAGLWKVRVARPLLALAGVLPVYRASDGDRTSDNRSVFEACERDLARGSMVAIFPEGTTGDRAGLDRVRSGAARIALGALPTAPDLVIVPIGMAFESRVETRSRTVVMFGEPIDVADHDDARRNNVSPGSGREIEADHDTVDRLTQAIGEALEAVSPEFASVDEREMLRAAARIERDDATSGGLASFGDIEVVARRLAAADDVARRAVIERYRSYATRLTLVGLDDRQVTRVPIRWARLVISAVAILVAGPLLLTVSLIFLPALVTVVAATALVQSTATKGTVRLLVGLATGLVTLIVAGVLIDDGWMAVFATLGVAIGGAVALVVWPPVVREGRGLYGWLTARDRGSLMRAVHADRDALIDAVNDAVSSQTADR